MSERTDANKLAEQLLDDAGADPDDDLRMLARQLLRRNEVIDRLEKELVALQDPHGDLVNANRDSILRIHEEGLRKIKKVIDAPIEHWESLSEILPKRIDLIRKILKAVNTFHPMHGESWCGWPEEGDK